MVLWEPKGILMAAGILLAVPALLGLLFHWGLKRFPKTRRIALGIIVLYFIAFGGFMAWRHTVPTVYHAHGMRASWGDSLADLEAGSAYIVEVTALGKSQRQLHNTDEYKWYVAHTDGFTNSEVRVEKVFHGSVQPGDIITVRESYHYARGIEGLWLLSWEIYMPMSKGGRYLLFLDESMRPISVHMGKHVVHKEIPSDFSPKILEVSGSSLHWNWDDMYLRIHKDVISKYMGN